MSQPTWIVPIVKLNDTELVVDLGNGHFVDLVGLENKIRIQKPSDVLYGDKSIVEHRKWSGFSQSIEGLECAIPYTSSSNSRGGRQSKVRRSRRLHRRVTRRTRR
jgi:hypothetical protein